MDREALRANYEGVLARGAAAAARAGRGEGSWRLVAVTKTVGADVARALAEMGAGDFGENRVQELISKREALSQREVMWHMIGHLQRNKVKKVVGAAELIHSVDSLRLAEEIERVAGVRGAAQRVLLEVNVSGEESKWGLSGGEAVELARRMGEMEHVALGGLMTMAPLVEEAEETRGVFRRLRELGGKMEGEGLFAGRGFELSMGMTQDFEVAIEEGATLVRVGSALFYGIGE